jgi:hypothetical protein
MASAIRVKVNQQQADAVAQRHGDRLVTLGMVRTFSRASVTAPVDTGNMRALHRMNKRVGKRRVVGRVISDARYSMAVHAGARPHVIRARGDGYLRFEAGGQVLYRKSVNHPGVRARPWLAHALADECRPLGFRISGTPAGVA